MRAKRLRYIVVLAVLAAAAAMLVGAPITSARSGAGGQSPLTAKEARALSTHITDRVIVVFKNQLSSLPDTSALRADRAAAVDQVQDPVVSELNLTHATHIKRFQLINAVAATVFAGRGSTVVGQSVRRRSGAGRADPSHPVFGAEPGPHPPQRHRPLGRSVPTPGPGAGGSTGRGGHPCRHPAGTGQSAQALGYTGAGVKVAFIADGIDIDNPDFIRSDGQHVFTDYQDFSGSGTDSPPGTVVRPSSTPARLPPKDIGTYNIADYAVGRRPVRAIFAFSESHPGRAWSD